MKKKGQIIVLQLMLAIILLIVAIAFIKPLTEGISDATDTPNLNCTDTDSSAVVKSTCTIIQTGPFYFVSVIIALGLSYVSGRRTINKVLTTVFIFIVIVMMITPLKTIIVWARSSDALNCGASNILVAARLSCIFVDIWLFYFIVLVIAGAGTYGLIAKVIPRFEKQE